jgi:hypothetical protein
MLTALVRPGWAAAVARISLLRPVRPVDAFARLGDAPLGLGGDGVLGDADALRAQFVRLPLGEVQLHGGGALLWHLLGEFVPVGARREDQRHLRPGDLRMPYGESVTVSSPWFGLRDRRRRQSRDEQ